MDQENNPRRAYALQAGEGWTYHFGIDFVVKAGEVREGGSVAFMEYVTAKGEEPDDHIHASEDEMFYVIDGALTFRCADESFVVEKGGFIFLPRGVRHGYTIRSDKPARLLVVTAPIRESGSGGWGGFVSDIELGQGELVAKPKHVE